MKKSRSAERLIKTITIAIAGESSISIGVKITKYAILVNTYTKVDIKIPIIAALGRFL
jgi:hypothetical protein